MCLKKCFDVVTSKPHDPADLVDYELATLHPTVDGHLSDAKKLGELFDGVKLLGQFSHGLTG